MMRRILQHSLQADTQGVLATAGMSLVPLADVFNHKTAIVQLSGEYAIEPVCFEGGKDSSDDDASSTDCGEDQCSDPGCSGESRSGLNMRITLLWSWSLMVSMRGHALNHCFAIWALLLTDR